MTREGSQEVRKSGSREDRKEGEEISWESLVWSRE